MPVRTSREPSARGTDRTECGCAWPAVHPAGPDAPSQPMTTPSATASSPSPSESSAANAAVAPPQLAWAIALAIFVSAFLLFQVQPLLGKFILPWFGGTPAVWTTAMLFFQVALFGGYTYAHLLSLVKNARTQAL